MSEATPQIIKNPDGSVLRRVWTKVQKRKIVEESFLPGTSVSIVARRHDVNTNQVFKWRRAYFRGELGKPIKMPTEFISIGVIGHDGQLIPHTEKPVSAPVIPPAEPPASVVPPVSQNPSLPASSPQGIIEVVLRQGVKVRLKGNVDLAVLRYVITTASALP